MTFMGPARITKMDRVGVIRVLATAGMVLLSSWPIHLYAVPLTLILPTQPNVDPCANSSGDALDKERKAHP